MQEPGLVDEDPEEAVRGHQDHGHEDQKEADLDMMDPVLQVPN